MRWSAGGAGRSRMSRGIVFILCSCVHNGTVALESRAATMLRKVFESGRPLTYVHSAEEQRVATVLREAGQGLASTPVPVWTWSLTEGMRRDSQDAESGTSDPLAALDFIAAHKGAAIFHLKDFHEPLRDSPEIRRRLRDLYEACYGRQKYVVITSPVRSIPEELERSLLLLELRPPDKVELVEFIRSDHGDLTDETLYQLAGALQGLTIDEARFALRRALAASPRLGTESLPALLEEKRLLINRSGVVEFVSEEAGMSDIGGLDNLQLWLQERRKLFQIRHKLDVAILPNALP